MSNHFTRVYIIVSFLTLSLHSFAQTDTTTAKFTNFVKNIKAFNKEYPQEKVYLHFDNTGYYLGETIWFKAYVVTAEEHLPTTLSRVLYVELLNPEGDVVITKKLKVENGQCHGDFQLKDSLFAGYYEVRAYTRYMLNFGNSEYWSRPSNTGEKFDYKTTTPEAVGKFVTYPYDSNSTIDNKVKKLAPFSGTISMPNGYSSIFPEGKIKAFGIGAWSKKCIENSTVFSRVFPVYNRPKTEGDYSQKTMFERPRINTYTDKTEPATQLFKLTFYPEGGSLVKELTSNVAFKAVDDKGKNIEVRGVVKTMAGKVVSEFSTEHEGMGRFSFIPQEDTYTAEVYYGSKIEKFNLPTCDNTGSVMIVHSPSADTLSVLLNTTEPTQLVGFSITCRGKVVDFRTVNLQALQPNMIYIPTVDLPTGVNQLTLFNQAGKVIAERLVFVNHQDGVATFGKKWLA
jgi:hypothetical protein